MMVGPWRALSAESLRHGLGDLRPEAQLMDLVREGVAAFDRAVEVVVEIVDVHGAVAEAAAGRDVEVADDLVDSEAALDAASLLSLFV